MRRVNPPEPLTLFRPPFRNYQFDGAYDEMFASPGVPRDHYRARFQTLLDLPSEELRKSQQAADLSFLHQGITFRVYGNEEGTERVFPNDFAAVDHSTRKVAQDRERPDPAPRRPELVPRRYL